MFFCPTLLIDNFTKGTPYLTITLRAKVNNE